MVKSGGENVSSVKVESCLLGHSGIRTAAVFGVPHPQWNEAVVAAVCLAPGAVADEGELIRFCKQHLAPFEVPKKILICEDLPQTATGKLQKFRLRQQFGDVFLSSESQRTPTR